MSPFGAPKARKGQKTKGVFQMKKNKMMRIASILMVVTLLSTCAISGTFAKYVTKAEGQDTARVAKWGVLVSVEGNAFAKQYVATDTAYKAAGGTLAVVSSTEDQVVAPGTDSTQVGSNMVATVKGTPEVAARYTIEGKGIKDVVLPAGDYTDYTQLVKAANGTYGYTGSFTLAKDYAPVKWNLTIAGKGKTINVAEELIKAVPANLAEQAGLTADGISLFDAINTIQKVAGNNTYKQIVETALGNIVSGGRNFQLEANKEAGTFKLSYDFDPNKEMDFTFTLGWKWAFEQTADVALYDKADTFLGNWAAVKLGQTIDGFVAPAAPASTVIDATFIATATQID